MNWSVPSERSHQQRRHRPVIDLNHHAGPLAACEKT